MTKSILFAIILVLASNAGFAQLTKGNILLAGSSNARISAVSSGTGGNNTTFASTIISVSPQVGYFIAERLPVGLYFEFQHENQYKYQINNSLEIGPFVRYYLSKSQRLIPFLDGKLGFGSTSSKSKYGDYGTTSKLFSASLGLGATYLLNRHVGLDISMGYNYNRRNIKSTYGSQITDENKYTSANLALNIGVVVLLGRNTEAKE